MGRKLFNGPLSLILTLTTLLFLVSFVIGQVPAPAPAPVPAPAPAPKTVAKAPAKDPKAAPAKEKAKTKNTKVGNNEKNAKTDAKINPPKLPTPPTTPAPPPPVPKVPPTTPKTPTTATAPPTTNTVDPNLAKECNDCWTSKRSELPACKGITNDEFAAFNQSPSSPKVASCLCIFANNMQQVFNDTCSAVCVDQNVINDINNQGAQFKTAYKCDDNGNSILGPSNLAAGNQTASAISNISNGNNMYLVSTFMIGMVSFLFFT
ncbi:hypothetical protein C1645_774597 [Glomus cerebriforme]|uniref:Extracellular membrane protein CFEM domain-containing protein n=1 Tax=Glomus cerebriforme TaxID=658196 RepID=A0A397T0C1_9GLOM|nr:hypothetical protein C1645_774597 [Glomus cerebriforme]